MNLLDIARAALAEVAPSPPVAPAAATPEQGAELRALVALVAADWPEAERAEALAVALADPADALTCFLALAAELPAPPRPYPAGPYTSAPLAERDLGDDRRICRDCANLSLIGRCMAKANGNSNTDAGRSGFPIDDLLRRCLAYAPKPDENDRRSGAERWPDMIEDALRRQQMAAQG